MTNFLGTPYTSQPDQGSNVRKNLAVIYWNIVKNQMLYFLWMQNCPNIVL